MTAAISYLLWVLFSILEGRREAFYFSYKMKASITLQKGLKTDEHVMFTIQRALVFALAATACYSNLLNTSLILFSLMLSFPFFHDGMYYFTRNRLDGIYSKKWFDQSTTSTAKSDKFNFFNPISRTILFGLSILGITYEIIIAK